MSGSVAVYGFQVYEVIGRKYAVHQFSCEDQFRAWRRLPENQGKDIRPLSQIRYFKRADRIHDEDHTFDFTLDY